MEILETDLSHLARLAISGAPGDVRLFVARLVRKYRDTAPALASELEKSLLVEAPGALSPMRKTHPAATPLHQAEPIPADTESRLSLLKLFEDTPDREKPILSEELEQSMAQLILERRQMRQLLESGLSPARSAIFVGPPGVGKTLTARWLAAQLQLPLYMLDLTAVMSSFLGRTGSNLRMALDFAKSRPCVLLLDEIDSIAKKRSDATDIGELKRLVTVILQEVDAWPTASLLLAATNHPELIDPALWRRFDMVVKFSLPAPNAVKAVMRRFLNGDMTKFEPWIDVLAFAFSGQSYSDIEQVISRFRRALVVNAATPLVLIEDFIRTRAPEMSREKRFEYAVLLTEKTRFSQHEISDLTGVSRVTIRKHGEAAKKQPKKQTKL